MYILENLTKLLSRFRYPCSLPEEVAHALGIHLANSLSFDEVVRLLGTPECRPTRLRKFMPRQQAEGAFQSAIKKESFTHMTLFSFYFSKGWLVFTLSFDEQSQLRRIYVQCPMALTIDDFEIVLEELKESSADPSLQLLQTLI